MERVLIVAKTRMGSAGVCVGGLTRSTSRSIRLIPSNRSNQPLETHFDVGQVWDIEFAECPRVTPPHVEDIIVTKQQQVGHVSNLHQALERHITPWSGGVEKIFDGLLTIGFSCYISREKGIPHCSTGYWIPDKPLSLVVLNAKRYYQITSDSGARIRVPYVGFAEPMNPIPAGTLVRVSLARWWAPEGIDEERCYLQLSGWY